MAHKQFVWIMTDTTGWNMLGCYGFEGVRTPNLDALARAALDSSAHIPANPSADCAFGAVHRNVSSLQRQLGQLHAVGRKRAHAGTMAQRTGCQLRLHRQMHLDGGDYFGEGVCPTAGIRITGTTCAIIWTS